MLQQVLISDHRKRFDEPDVPAEVRNILIDPGNAVPARDGFAPLERVAVLDLFIGGNGTLGLTGGSPPQVNTGSPNFLARNRNHFAAEGFVVAVVDAANGFNDRNNGLRGQRRPDRPLGLRHLADLAAVLSDLRTRYGSLPVWAVGNSRGTVSAAVTATSVTPPADGLVLTSSLTGPDACPITRPEDSDALRDRFSASARVHVMHVSGGSTPISNACDPLAPHGFFGIDQKVVDAITKWIKHSEH